MNPEFAYTNKFGYLANEELAEDSVKEEIVVENSDGSSTFPNQPITIVEYKTDISAATIPEVSLLLFPDPFDPTVAEIDPP